MPNLLILRGAIQRKAIKPYFVLRYRFHSTILQEQDWDNIVRTQYFLVLVQENKWSVSGN